MKMKSPLKILVFFALISGLDALPPSSPDFLKKVQAAVKPILDAAGAYYQVQMVPYAPNSRFGQFNMH